MLFSLITLVAIAAGIVASIAGFGIGSLITPIIALKTGTSIAVAAVSFVHFFGTALRFYFWRAHVNKQVLLTFGITSAVGGLIGALLHNVLFSSVLTIIFGSLLILSGIMGFTGLGDRLRLKGISAWIAGGVSGFFGGLVGNQGGVRSAALFGFKLNRMEFIATATGIALVVDIVRMPVYLATQASALAPLWPIIVMASIAVMVGTFVGSKLLEKIPEQLFKKIVSVIIFLVGILIVSGGLIH